MPDREVGSATIELPRGDDGGWPLVILITNDLAQRYVRAGSDDLVELRVEDERAIYRLEEFDRRGKWRARLVYSEDLLGGYP